MNRWLILAIHAMLLERIKRRNGRFLCRLSCDTCDKEFLRGEARRSSEHGDFCSRKCSSTNVNVMQQKVRTTINTYGVPVCALLPFARERAKRTCVERYGVENPFESAQIMSKVDQRENVRKRHETMKLNGTYSLKQSRDEDACFEALCGIYGPQNVERHVEANGNDIDLYVRHLDVYVQVDGVYWHGLDRSLDAIQEFRSPRDRVIYGTVLRDAACDAWFEQNGKRLIRITDQEIRQWQSERSLRQRLASLLATKSTTSVPS